MNFPTQDLTLQQISQSYQSILQQYGEYVLDGLGNVVFRVGTESGSADLSNLINSSQTSSMRVLSSSYASTANISEISMTSYYADVAESSLTSSISTSASYSANSTSASYSLTSRSSSFSTTASFSTVAASSTSASFSNTSSYSSTASYLAPGGTINATASWSDNSVSSSYALTASYVVGGGTAGTSSYVSGSSAVLGSLKIVGATDVYIDSVRTTNIVAATVMDSFPTSQGNSAKWLLSMTDGTAFKTSEVMAIWDPVSEFSNFSEITTNALGNVQITFSVNLSAGLVRLVANPSAGNWTVKACRMVL